MKKEYYKYEDIAVPLYSDGEIIDFDVPANVLYGFVGSYLNISDTTLFWGGNFAQITDNFGAEADDPRDRRRISQGIERYKQWSRGKLKRPRVSF